MSGHNEDKKLRDFLRSSAAEGDDFEKEALEGFAMLKNDEEAMQAKAELDQRIYREVFYTRSKPGRQGMYYAAAAVLLLAGFAIFMMRGSLFDNRNEMAVQRELNPPAEVQTLRAPPAQVQSATAEDEKKSPAEPKQKTHEKTISPAKTLPELQEAEQGNSVADHQPASQGKAEASPVSEGVSPSQTNDLALSEADHKKAATAGAQVAYESQQPETKLAAEGDFALNSAAQKPSAAPTEPPRKNAYAKRAVPAEKKPASKNCYYPEGEKGLRDDVQKLFQPKDLVIRFDAILRIDRAGRILEVEFKEQPELSAETKEKISATLKQLKPFQFYNSQGNEVPAEYRLDFKP
jgi:hypothetical protein